MGCNAIQSGSISPTLRRNVLLEFSDSKNRTTRHRIPKPFSYPLNYTTNRSNQIFMGYFGKLSVTKILLRSYVASNNIVMYRPIARQRLDKHIPAEAYARKNRRSIGRQRFSKQVFSTIEGLHFLHGPYRGVIKGQRKSFEWVVVENWVEFRRWQYKVMRTNGKKLSRLCKEDFMYDLKLQ
jgi:hypothetical protein